MLKLWKSALPLLIFNGVLLGVFIYFALSSSRQENPDEREPANAPIKLPTSSPSQQPIASAPQPTPADEDNEKMENARAKELLRSTNQSQRIEGLELLGAYPSPTNEAILADYLVSRESPEIRSIAAISLSTLENPTPSTIDTLLNTLDDPSEDMRFSALSTLEDYLTVAESGSAAQRRIQKGLRSKLESKCLQADIQKDIDDIVHDR